MKKLLIILAIGFVTAGMLSVPAKAQYKDLLNFNNINGQNPYGSLILSGHTLYGMTNMGGANDDGVVFSIDTDGTGYTDLVDFNGTNGKYPSGSLLLSGHTLYGVTEMGGANDSGVVFSINTNGSGYTDLFDFNGTNGKSSNEGSLILSGKTLYGMTWLGGAYHNGVIFSIDTNGTRYTDLLDFNGTNGKQPKGSLLLSGSTLYGTTQEGGIYGDGVIFSIDTNGTGYTTLKNFNGTNGENPNGSLILSGHTLYGMTWLGGAVYGNGIIFSINTNGTRYTDLWDFDINNYTNGSNPDGSLILSGKTLYGMTLWGGRVEGNLFSIDTNGNGYTNLVDFVKTNGLSPTGSLLLSGNTLYGMTPEGGTDDSGVVFSYTLLGNIMASTIANVSCQGNDNGEALCTIKGGASPYTYLWSNASSQTTALATGLSAGIYTVTVSDSTGASVTASVNITQPNALQVVHDSVNADHNCNGVAGVTVSGGTSPYTYLWSPGNQTTDSITSQCAGTYTCTITDNNGCSQTTMVTIKNTTGIEGIASNAGEITVYPNPSNGKFTMQSSVVSGQLAIEVYNMLGEDVYSTSLYLPNKGDFYIDLSNQPNGVYLYKVIKNDGKLIGKGKVLIQK